MSTFTKLTNGNVIFEDDNGNEHNFGKDVYVKEQSGDNLMLIPENLKSAFIVDWNDVTVPEAASKQDLFDQLTQNFFKADQNAALLATVDTVLNVVNVKEYNPLFNRYSGRFLIASSAQLGSADGVYTDKGDPIDTKGYKKLFIGVVLTKNNSTGHEMRVLFNLGGISTVQYIKPTDAEYHFVLGDVSLPGTLYEVNVEGVDFVQVQTRVLTLSEPPYSIIALEGSLEW
ncbi:MAG: hypothetical protein L3J35_03640 [Bacteroidales bacterium]|nr:hypothetical protein [Bacteroidales bacterium]